MRHPGATGVAVAGCFWRVAGGLAGRSGAFVVAVDGLGLRTGSAVARPRGSHLRRGHDDHRAIGVVDQALGDAPEQE